LPEEPTNPFGAPMPSPELRRLEPLLGKWQTTARTQASGFRPAIPVTSIEEFYWLEGGYFLVQTYEIGDELAQKGVTYWFYDAHAGNFHIIFFSNNGPFTEQGNRYEGEVVDGTLRFMGPARFPVRPGRLRQRPKERGWQRADQIVAARRRRTVSAMDGQCVPSFTLKTLKLRTAPHSRIHLRVGPIALSPCQSDAAESSAHLSEGRR
jgi:hypothetical protein